MSSGSAASQIASMRSKATIPAATSRSRLRPAAVSAPLLPHIQNWQFGRSVERYLKVVSGGRLYELERTLECPYHHANECPKMADHRLTKSVPIDPEKPFRFTNRGRSTNKINALAECPVLDSLRSRSANEI
jgi:hypothetical protein